MNYNEGMFHVQQTIGTVLCCKCGTTISPNAVNMCANCLRSEVDITEGLIKRATIIHCPECNDYLEPPTTRIKAQLESKELLAFCLRKLKSNMDKCKVRKSQADFIWTEPHSKRIKVRIKVQKEVLNSVILEQIHVVEFIQQEHLCDSCTKIQANPDQWVASVQVRQHVSHRRTFFYIEQMILKHNAASNTIKIKQMHKGMDFFFENRSHAVKFVEFISKVTPSRSRHDKQLVSHDPKSNNYNYKYTFSVEIPPICREDLICLPPKVASSFGNLGPLVLCTKVTNSIAILDPISRRHCFMDSDQYWRYSFKPLLTSRQLVMYIVLDVEITSPEVTIGGVRYAAAEVQVARVSDFGKNDTMFFSRTHLGGILKAGDHALGYDLYGMNIDVEVDKYKGLVMPEVVLVKKSYEERRRRRRPWKVKRLQMDVDEKDDKGMNEYEEFLRDLETNPDMRFNVSLYRDGEYQASENGETAEEDEAPSVPLEELLADLELRDEEMEDSSQ